MESITAAGRRLESLFKQGKGGGGGVDYTKILARKKNRSWARTTGGEGPKCGLHTIPQETWGPIFLANGKGSPNSNVGKSREQGAGLQNRKATFAPKS